MQEPSLPQPEPEELANLKAFVKELESDLQIAQKLNQDYSRRLQTLQDKTHLTESAIWESRLFKDLESQLRKTLDESQQRLIGYKNLSDKYESLKQEKVMLYTSETHLKAEVTKLRKDQDEQSRKLVDLMKTTHEEANRLRQENLSLQTRLFALDKIVRQDKRDEEMKATEQSLTKQFAMSVSRAEDAEKRLAEKVNEIQQLKVQLRDSKVMTNDLRLKLDQLKGQIPTGTLPSQPPAGQKYSYEEVLHKYDSLKYSFRKVDESRIELEKQVQEAKGQLEKKNAEVDSLYLDNSSVYGEMEKSMNSMKTQEAALKSLEENNLTLSKAQIQLRQELSDATMQLTALTSTHRAASERLSALEALKLSHQQALEDLQSQLKLTEQES